MSLFQPVNVTGPAHRGNQIAMLAQTAAHNVMRKQKMKSLLGKSARGAAGAGAAQAFQSALRAHPQGIHGHVQGRTDMGGDFLNPAVSQLAQITGNGGNMADPGMNPSGSGYDFPSVPDNTDPSQSPASVQPNIGDAITQQPAPYLTGNGWTPSGTEGTTAPGGNPNPTGSPYGGIPAPIGSSLIHLGGGMYYDPATDSVTNGAQGATKPGLHY